MIIMNCSSAFVFRRYIFDSFKNNNNQHSLVEKRSTNNDSSYPEKRKCQKNVLTCAFAAVHVEHTGPSLDIRRRPLPGGRPIGQVLLGIAVFGHFAVHQSEPGPGSVRHRRTVAAVINCPDAVLRKEKRYGLSTRRAVQFLVTHSRTSGFEVKLDWV